MSEDREFTAEARTDPRLVVRGHRGLPVGHHQPVLARLGTDDEALIAAVALRPAPRFRPATCLQVPWSISLDVDRGESMPSAIEVRTLTAAGDTTVVVETSE